MKWIESLLQEVKAYRTAKARMYPNPHDKYFPKIKVRSFGKNCKLSEKGHGIW